MSMDHPLYVQASLETLSRLQPGERGVSLDQDRRAKLIAAPTLTHYRLSTLEMRNRMAGTIHTACTAWLSLPPANRPPRKMFLTRTTLKVINHYFFLLHFWESFLQFFLVLSPSCLSSLSFFSFFSFFSSPYPPLFPSNILHLYAILIPLYSRQWCQEARR